MEKNYFSKSILTTYAKNSGEIVLFLEIFNFKTYKSARSQLYFDFDFLVKWQEIMAF